MKKAQALLEIIIVVGIVAIIGVTAAGAVFVSLRSSEAAKKNTAGANLSQEALDAIKAITDSDDPASQGWNKILCPPDGNCAAPGGKGSANSYKVQLIDNQWQLSPGEESFTFENVTYTRKVFIRNVCRSAGNITGITDSDGTTTSCTTFGGTEDPSTQQIVVQISAPGIPTIQVTDYLTRFRSQLPIQTDWSGGQGVFGPVLDFGKSFDICDTTDCSGLDFSNTACSGGDGTCLRLQQP